MLRNYMISFLLTVEGLMTELDTLEEHDCEETGKLIKNIEYHLHQLTLYQQIADKMFLETAKEQRQTLYREAPETLKLFGWYDKIDEAGDIVKKP